MISTCRVNAMFLYSLSLRRIFFVAMGLRAWKGTDGKFGKWNIENRKLEMCVLTTGKLKMFRDLNLGIFPEFCPEIFQEMCLELFLSGSTSGNIPGQISELIREPRNIYFPECFWKFSGKYVQKSFWK